MARSFDGTNDYLENAANPLPSHGTNAFTVAFWFRALTNGRTNDYVCSGIGGRNAGSILYEYVNNTVEFYNGAGSGTDARTNSGLVVADTNWHHIAYRKQNGTAEWAKYLDGSKTVIDAAINFSLTGATDPRFLLGSSDQPTGDFANVELAEFAVWSSAVADGHIESMADGASPLFFAPDHYWALIGQSPEQARRGTLNLTVGGATIAAHPRVYYPAGAQYGNTSITAAPATVGSSLICWF